MSKKVIIWSIIGVCLLVIGCLLCVFAMSSLGWDFKKLSTVRFESEEHFIAESFESIDVSTDTASIEFVP